MGQPASQSVVTERRGGQRRSSMAQQRRGGQDQSEVRLVSDSHTCVSIGVSVAMISGGGG